MPSDATAPVRYPSRKPWLVLVAPARATSSGTSAIQATRPWPNFGNDSASRMPDAVASDSARPNAFKKRGRSRLLLHHERVELLAAQLLLRLLGLGAGGEWSHPHVEQAVLRGDEIGGEALDLQAADHRLGRRAVLERADLQGERADGGG